MPPAEKTNLKAVSKATYQSQNKPTNGICLWCGQVFERPTSKGHPFLCANKRCSARWGRVKQKHGLTRFTDPAIVQGYRFLGDAYYAIQCVKRDTPAENRGASQFVGCK